MSRYVAFMFASLLALALALPQSPAVAAAPSAPPSLLIVAPSDLIAPLAPLVEHKARTGIPTTTVALRDTLATLGVDDAERLKRFLYERRQQDRSLHYVLLVGDADRMPVRFMVLDRVTEAAADTAFYPSDLYYADLCAHDGGFESWNGARDGFHADYFGEVHGEKNKQDPINLDGIDYVPEIAVGRWPVATPVEVTRMVQKTIAMETWVAEGGGRSAAILGVPGWIDARATLQQIADRLPPAWSIQRLWWQDRGKSDAAILAPSIDHARAACASGIGVLLHAGHGSEHGFDQCLGLSQIGDLTNVHPFVVMSIGCTTARLCTLPPYEAYLDSSGKTHQGTNAGEHFSAPPPPPAVYQRDQHNPSSFGEQILRGTDHGAAAYIGCNTGGQPCALTLLSAFGEALGDPAKATLGDAWLFAVAEYHRRERLAQLKPTADWYPPSIFFQAMKYLLLGDPSLRLPGRPLPAAGHAAKAPR